MIPITRLCIFRSPAQIGGKLHSSQACQKN
jgi:hypothetical protein